MTEDSAAITVASWAIVVRRRRPHRLFFGDPDEVPVLDDRFLRIGPCPGAVLDHPGVARSRLVSPSARAVDVVAGALSRNEGHVSGADHLPEYVDGPRLRGDDHTVKIPERHIFRAAPSISRPRKSAATTSPFSRMAISVRSYVESSMGRAVRHREPLGIDLLRRLIRHPGSQDRRGGEVRVGRDASRHGDISLKRVLARVIGKVPGLTIRLRDEPHSLPARRGRTAQSAGPLPGAAYRVNGPP